MRWLLAALLLASAGEARAQDTTDTIEYRVRPGDTCASVARRFFGDARSYDRIHAHNPDLGAPPHRLSPGTVLRLPRGASPASPDARITAARRRVESRPPRAERWQPARVGQPLAAGSQVATHDRAYAALTFRDDSRLEMREHTLVVIYGGSRGLARRTDAEATLERGALRSRLSELAGRVEVETPSSRAEVAAGSAVLTVEEDGTSRLANLGGATATVTAGSTRVRVPAGTGTVVPRGGRPSPPRPLPSAPRWSNDLAGRFVGLTGSGGTLRGSWEPAPDASRYRVEIAAAPDGSDVVAAVEVPGDRHGFEVHGLPPGVYYVSVATIDTALFEGPPSPLRAMQVLSARVIPPGGSEPVEAPYDPGDPSRRPAPPRVLPGTWVVAPVGMRCGAGDGEPREMITLREPGRARVRCLDPAGREVPAFAVDVVRVEARVAPRGLVLVRGRTAEARLHLDSTPAPPARLVATAPAGVDVDTPRREPDGAYLLRVTPAPDAPDRAAIEVGTMAGTELVPLASVLLPVVDPPGAPPDEPEPPPAEEPPRPAPFPHALDSTPTPLFAALRDPITRGASLWLSGAVAHHGRLEPAAGARARVFEEPLRLGFAWSGDLALDASWSFVEPTPDGYGLSLDFTIWIPTRIERGGLRHARAVPSLGLEWHGFAPLHLRLRQAALVDLDEGGERTAASALGADVLLYDLLALGLELDTRLAFGEGVDVDAHLAASAALRLGPLEPALALAANPDGFDGVVLSLRVRPGS